MVYLYIVKHGAILPESRKHGVMANFETSLIANNMYEANRVNGRVEINYGRSYWNPISRFNVTWLEIDRKKFGWFMNEFADFVMYELAEWEMEFVATLNVPTDCKVYRTVSGNGTAGFVAYRERTNRVAHLDSETDVFGKLYQPKHTRLYEHVDADF